MVYIIIIAALFTALALGYGFLYYLDYRISLKQTKLIHKFTSRTDLIPSLYEVSREHISKQDEIFKEIFSLRKKEFSFKSFSKNIEAFIRMEQHIHHEINFIFQICNKNPKLLKEKNFLYLRDVMIQKSAEIGKDIKRYNKIIEIYNRIIDIKNYSIIWLVLPFHKKTAF